MAFDDLLPEQKTSIIKLIEQLNSGKYENQFLAYGAGEGWFVILCGKGGETDKQLDGYSRTTFLALQEEEYLTLESKPNSFLGSPKPKAFGEYQKWEEEEIPDKGKRLARKFARWYREFKDDVYTAFERGDESKGKTTFLSWEKRFLNFLKSDLPGLERKYRDCKPSADWDTKQWGSSPLENFMRFDGVAVESFLEQCVIDARKGNLVEFLTKRKVEDKPQVQSQVVPEIQSEKLIKGSRNGNAIQKKKVQRFSYLKRLYELSGGNRLASFPFVEIGKELGLDDATSDEITDYLKGEDLVDFPSWGTVCITHTGTKVIEEALSNLHQSTAYFPAIMELPQIPISLQREVELSPNKVSILFLSADPSDASRLRLGEEFREIQEKLKLAKLREHFSLELPQLSVRTTDISQALLDVHPQIVHFSGHGTSTGALCFENQLGQTLLVQPDALASLFEQFANQVNCVLLNARYSEIQAKAIGRHIKYVIGMNQAIGDKAAIAFTIGFYQALGAGRTIEDAYNLGCVQIRLQGISEYFTPVLIKRDQARQ